MAQTPPYRERKQRLPKALMLGKPDQAPFTFQYGSSRKDPEPERILAAPQPKMASEAIHA